MSKQTQRRRHNPASLPVRDNLQDGQQPDIGDLVMLFFGDRIREHLLRRGQRKANGRSAA